MDSLQPSLFQQGEDLPLFSQKAPAFRPEEMHEHPGPCDRCGHLPIRGVCLCPETYTQEEDDRRRREAEKLEAETELMIRQAERLPPAALGADAPDDPPGELFSRVQEYTESRKEA